MKIVARAAMAAAATAGLIFAGGGPADAVPPHKHCLYTPSPEGYVLIAEGVSEAALDAGTLALEKFHTWVHRGQPGQELTFYVVSVDAQSCPDDLQVLPADAIALE